VDGLTPSNSSQKKHTHTAIENVDRSPSPSLLFPPNSTEPSSAADDVFGPKIAHNKSLNGDPSKPGTLFNYWQPESGDSKIERNHHNFEELMTSRKKCELKEEKRKEIQKDQWRVVNKSDSKDTETRSGRYE